MILNRPFFLKFILFSHVFQDYLQSCLNQIEEMVASAFNSRGVAASAVELQTTNSTNSSASGRQEQTDKLVDLDHNKAGTPTDVRDIHF